MGILSGNPKNEPMHYGEVFGVWSYLAANKGLVAGYETLINHTGDQDLRKFIEDKVHNVLRPEIQQIEELLKVNGVELPPAPPDRPVANIESIPPGARFHDNEIVISISADISSGLISCSTIIGQCIREDIAMMFSQFHATKIQYGGRLLRMRKEKGWLIPPPLHTVVKEPAYV